MIAIYGNTIPATRSEARAVEMAGEQASATLRPVAVCFSDAGYTLYPLTLADAARYTAQTAAGRPTYIVVGGELRLIASIARP